MAHFLAFAVNLCALHTRKPAKLSQDSHKTLTMLGASCLLADLTQLLVHAGISAVCYFRYDVRYNIIWAMKSMEIACSIAAHFLVNLMHDGQIHGWD
jgi:hypothetical protein